ncbi:Predicted oxidoreductase [Limimonas halophila]|uniref:Protein tas n=1 Tax=Limimonas halophila TaxID=1082479 RepID=A0A1G7R6D0_9PROT|nr:NADP(H)-dependent aldo-keto reductase [Limimonas halophila]SDG06267.1 Predicted oxidoreductase [Limimonas halophila]
MEYRPLGRTGLRVSALCLGTMTWGTQNTRDEAFEQMDYALERGINFVDTAEMYPTPYQDELHGRTEEIIGAWLKARGTRDKIVLASKALGPGQRFAHVRGGPRFTRENLENAVDASLRRLGTDAIDLYQLHWPERPSNYFGKLGFDFTADGQWTPLEDTLEALDAIQRSGKIKHVGVSNETPWGVMRYLALAEQGGGPRIASIQNPYSLLNRSFEAGNAEIAIREDCGLLAYAPLAAGMLTGKYLHGAEPPDARLTLYPQNSRYRKPQGLKATEAYVDAARRHGLDPAQMAIRYVVSRPFTTAAIIGATKMSQLKADIDAHDVTLSEELLAELEDIHRVYTYPCP